MRRCSKCGAEAADSHDACGICGAPFDGVESVGCPRALPVKAPIVWGAPFGLKPSQPAVGVPRRFGVGTMMILTTVFAVLFGILKTAGVDPAVFAAVSVFMGGVAVCQVLLFKGKDPRKASFVGGIITFGVVAAMVAVEEGFRFHRVEYAIQFAFWGGLLTPVAGGPLGYAAGCLVAAVFLVRKEPDDAEPTPEESAKDSP